MATPTNNMDEKPITFGAVVQDAPINSTSDIPLRPQPSASSSLNASTPNDAAGIDSTNPYSAFYKHPEARRSLEASSALQSKTHLEVDVRDLEAGSLPLSAATTQNPKVSVDGRVKECTMWPSRQTIMENKKMNKRARGCKQFRNLNSKQRLWAKILIAALVIAAAVGLGVGISRAVGGGIWKSKGHTQEIV
ncbi:unnamed protein product [Periconia digitata]|uniref:Uncharacterized protein n=1 Tax=Periconia digitata TaxID=1303443 RepID=A0A9W4UVS7_9PLEO|nr:unnamed protein product [Periconia digitata]